MTKSANRWLVVCAATALAMGASACHKSQTATDLSNSSADATAAAPTDNSGGAMTADNATNDTSSSNAAGSGSQ